MFQSGLGIYIETSRVTAVWIKSSFGRETIADCEQYALNPDAPEETRLREAADFISRYASEKGGRSAGIHVGIPADRVMLRRIRLPLAVKENLRSTLTFEMEKYLPVSADQVVFDYQILQEKKTEGMLDLLVAAVRKNELDGLYTMIKSLPSGVSGLDIGPSAIAAAGHHNAGLSGGSFMLMACHGMAATQVCLAQGGRMVACRSVVDGDASKIPEYAANLLCSAGLAAESVPCHLVGAPFSEDVLRAWKQHGALSDWEPLYLTGLSSGCRASYWEAYGLALKGVQQAVGFNLLPPRLRKRSSRLGYYTLAVLLFLIIATGMGWVGSRIARERMALNLLNEELTRVKHSLGGLETLSASVNTLSEQFKILDALYEGRWTISDIMAELTRILPKNAWLMEITLGEDKGTIYGLGDSAADLIALIEQADMFHNVSLQSPITRHGNKERFRIEFDIVAPAAGK